MRRGVHPRVVRVKEKGSEAGQNSTHGHLLPHTSACTWPSGQLCGQPQCVQVTLVTGARAVSIPPIRVGIIKVMLKPALMPRMVETAAMSRGGWQWQQRLSIEQGQGKSMGGGKWAQANLTFHFFQDQV